MATETTETRVFHPGEFDRSDYAFYRMINGNNPVGKSYTNSSRADMYTNGTGDNYSFWPFSVSVIPDGAEIISVECTITAYLDNVNSLVSSATAQLYSGATEKGTASSIKTSETTPISLNTGSWTRGELESIRLKLFVRVAGDIRRHVYFHGADLTIQFTYKTEQFLMKINDSWAGASTVYKKINGIWVEQTELANVIEDGVRYKNGGEVV